MINNNNRMVKRSLLCLNKSQGYIIGKKNYTTSPYRKITRAIVEQTCYRKFDQVKVEQIIKPTPNFSLVASQSSKNRIVCSFT